MKYKNLFFDLDHTLWDFEANARETLTEVYDTLQLEEKLTCCFDKFHTCYITHNAQLWDRFQKGFISAEELKWRRMWRTLLDFQNGDEQLAKQMSELFLDILPTKKLLFEHTKELLEYLTEKKYVIHIITNGFEKIQWKKINNSELSKYFTHVITSEASNSVKPAKEIFEYAIKKANTTFEQSIMIGDNIDADIKGAMNAGLDSIFVNHINATTEVLPTYTVTNLKQIEGIL
ncbi:YjjG family noncanonical pyrimidine nucleotidase [soil metagenome]